MERKPSNLGVKKSRREGEERATRAGREGGESLESVRRESEESGGTEWVNIVIIARL